MSGCLNTKTTKRFGLPKTSVILVNNNKQNLMKKCVSVV